MSSLLKLSYVFKRAPIIVVWDGEGKNWRKEISNNRYKGNRTPWTPGELSASRSQKAIIHEILIQLRIPSFRVEDMEADDLVGILSMHLADDLKFENVIIRSGDMDFYQLLDNPAVKILAKYDQSLEIEDMLVTPKKVRDRFNGPGS